VPAIAQCFAKCCHVQAKLFGVADKVLLFESLLVREQQVVHFPEPSLPRRFKCGFVCEGRVRMNRQRVMLEDHLHVGFKCLPHFLQHRFHARAKRTLEIRVQKNHHASSGGTARGQQGGGDRLLGYLRGRRLRAGNNREKTRDD
jgi:hypothetical protein